MATTCKLIAKTTLGSSAANIQFTSIPATHTDLLVLCSLRTERASIGDDVLVRFNGSTTSYSDRVLYGNGSSAASYSSSAQGFYGIFATAATAAANTFSNGEIYIPNYAGSTNKSAAVTNVAEDNGTVAYVHCSAGLWADTAAITSVTLVPQTGPNFVSGSTAYLYGITKS
jgi:hypothetical protein